jgi:hypothetical protein
VEALALVPTPIPVAGAYLPCLLSWENADPSDADLASIRAAVQGRGRDRVISIDPRRHVLLVSEGPRPAMTRQHLRETVAEVARAVHERRPEARIHTVIGQRIRPGEHLEAVASRLSRVERQAVARGCQPIASARHYSLVCLLERLDARDATAFVQEQLAGLAAYDREHGTSLLRVLELALDLPDRNAAARAAFMHRNTVRRQLRTALDLIDADLDCPEERLALHLALKMRALGLGHTRLRPAS